MKQVTETGPEKVRMSKRDKAILGAIKEGRDDAALSFLYKETYPKVRGMILKNNGKIEDAKDIFQDAVVVFYKYVKTGRYNEESDIDGFIYGVSRNLFAKMLSKKKLTQELDTVSHFISSDDTLENDMITKEKEQTIAMLMDELGERCKELITLSVFHKLSMKEICEKMGFANENAAKTGNYKCKQRLMKMIEKNPALIEMFRN